MAISGITKQAFIQTVWEYYADHQRVLPWRQAEADGTFDPYKIVVSEFMLQQTQAERVVGHYVRFIKRFPDFASLASASLVDVLIAWQGLGYNRRAKYLHEAGKIISAKYDGIVPENAKQLEEIKGIGPNTAGAIVVYSYNQPEVFIETNVRTVYLHHFFKNEAGVPDSALIALVQETVDSQNPRLWYWALMDYGVYIKKTHGNVSQNSSQYAKQSSFAGSRRQVRGKVIKALTVRPLSLGALSISVPDERLMEVLDILQKEGLITRSGKLYSLAQ